METEKCPRCESSDFLTKKMILIGKRRTPFEIYASENYEGYNRKENLSVDQLKEEHVQAGPTEAFVDGLYCENCKIGFVPFGIVTEKTKADAQQYYQAMKRYFSR